MTKHRKKGSAIGPYGFLKGGHLKELRKSGKDLQGKVLKNMYPNYDAFFQSMKESPSLALKVCILYEKRLLEKAKNDIKKAAAFNLYGYEGMRKLYQNPTFSKHGNMTVGKYASNVVKNSEPLLATRNPIVGDTYSA